MNLTAFAIDKDRITLVGLFLILVAGIQAFLTLPQNEDPGFIIRTAQVVTYFPGASPARVEQLVTDKLEEVIQEIPELDFVNSESRTGVSIVLVNVKERFRDMRPIWDNLRRKVDKIEGDLPEGVIGPDVNDEFGDVFGIAITITGEGFTYAQLKDVADDVRDEYLRLSDVAKVDIYGAQEERVFVEYDNSRLAELGISPSQLSQILESRNIIIPGGAINVGRERIALEPSGNFDSVADLRQTIIELPGQTQVVYLQDIATVTRGYIDPPSSKVSSSGIPALGLGISMREGGNIVALGEQVMAKLRDLEASYPIGIEFDVVSFQPAQVEKKIKDFAGNLLQAIAVVAAVMLLMLGLRTGVIIATLIPVAMITTLFVMSLLGVGLDQMSLAALIISLGMLVDNGIVMAESIMVQMEAGKSPVPAAVDSAAELKIPLLTSSLTTAAAFLPIYLAESTVGEYTAPIFIVVTITLLCSWFVTMTVIPLLCVRFMKVKDKAAEAGFDTRFYRSYRATLLAALRYPLVTILLVIALFSAAIHGLSYVPNIFFPPSDRNFFKAEFEFPIGTSIETTEEMVEDLERFLTDHVRSAATPEQGVVNWVSYVGNGGPRFVLQHSPEPSSPHYVLMVINTVKLEDIDGVIARLEGYVLDNYPDVQSIIRKFENGPPVEDPVQVRLSGKDTQTLFSMVDQVKAALSDTPGAKNITDDWGARTKKLVVRIDQARALTAGVTSQDIAVSLQTGLSGLELTEYREGEDIIPVTLRSVASQRQDINKLESLAVYAQATGRSLPLKQVADVEVLWEPAKILRRDRLKTVTVSSQLQPGVTATEVLDRLTPWLDTEQSKWAVGYRYEYGGEFESSVKANKSIADKLPIAGLIILILLVAQFNSMRRPLIILVTIPLGLIGVTIGLLVMRSYFGFMTLLGLISLAGIVINNAIVLIDRIKIEIEEFGRTPQQAVIEAAQRRLRPIFLSTVTTVLGLVPLYLGGGPMWEPMAIAIMFGLIFATPLTLGLVPVLYSLFFKVRYKGYAYQPEVVPG